MQDDLVIDQAEQDLYDKNETVKNRTIELYDKLPMTSLEDRKACTEIRDEIIELNYSYFVFLAKKLYVDNPSVTFEDKLQTIIYWFCVLWPEWRFPKINKYGQYKDYKNLSFAVFFKPRLFELSRRELNVIKYSLRRSLCSKAANMLNKEKWADVTKEDIAKLNLPQNELDILERIFNNKYTKDIDKPETGTVIKSMQLAVDTVEELYTENYDSVVDLIVHEMIEQESKLSDSHLLKMANLYTIPYDELLKARPLGEAKLKQKLEDAINLQNTFQYDTDYYVDEDDD